MVVENDEGKSNRIYKLNFDRVLRKHACDCYLKVDTGIDGNIIISNPVN